MELIGFQNQLERHGFSLRRTPPRVLQVNVGKVCNQVCRHCHVDAGPHRSERMDSRTVDEVLAAAERCGFETVDLTGGAPELNPHFTRLVRGAAGLGCRVIDRCNLTVFFEPGQENLPEFLAEQGVEVIASLPCYLPEYVDLQRGPGVFSSSVQALQRLNGLGYGRVGSGLTLNLVFNPLGAELPPEQGALEARYRVELAQRFDISFNKLFTLTNLPISRFAGQLRRQGQYEAYMELLVQAFNLAALEGLMCRDTVSVGWDGRLYDCDFNQMLEMPMPSPYGHIRELQLDRLEGASISVGEHCYGCTAGRGSSCGGALVV